MDELKLLVVAYMVNEVPIDTGNNFLRTLLKNNALHLNHIELYNKYGLYGTHNYIEKYIKDNGVNAVLLSSGPSEFYFEVSRLEELRKNVFLAMMTGDTETYFEESDKYYAQAMDLVIVPNFITTFKVHEIGVDSMAYWAYFDTAKYRKIENLPKDIDVSFVGTLGERIGRADYVKYLLDNGINIRTFGSDSPGGQITFDKKIEIINRSKINVDFSGASRETRLTKKRLINKRIKQLKGKCFEAAICGSFALCEYAPGLEYFFDIDKEKELDIFCTKKELLEKVRYYLKNEKEREDIAKRGYRRSTRDYDVNLAVPKLTAKINELRKKKVYEPSIIYLDEGFIRHYATFRVLSIIKFIKSGKWKLVFEQLKIILKYRKLDLYQVRVFFIEEILGPFPKFLALLKRIFKKRKDTAMQFKVN